MSNIIETDFSNDGVKCLHTTPGFSINRYDREGDDWELGIYLHYGDTSIKIAKNLDGFNAHIEHLKKVAHEIKENY